MDPTESSALALTLEATISAMTRVDTLWNIFLGGQFAMLTLLAAIYRRLYGPLIYMILIPAGLFLYINMNGLQDAYWFLRVLFDAVAARMRPGAEGNPAMLGLLGYYQDMSWRTPLGGQTWPAWVLSVIENRHHAIHVTHATSALLTLIGVHLVARYRPRK